MKKIILAMLIFNFSGLEGCHKCVGTLLKLEETMHELIRERMKDPEYDRDMLNGISIGINLGLRAAAESINKIHPGYRLSDEEYEKLFPELSGEKNE